MQVPSVCIVVANVKRSKEKVSARGLVVRRPIAVPRLEVRDAGTLRMYRCRERRALERSKFAGLGRRLSCCGRKRATQVHSVCIVVANVKRSQEK